MKFTTHQLVTMTIFSTLWRMVEIRLGSELHAL
jgi:hypothetical protein